MKKALWIFIAIIVAGTLIYILICNYTYSEGSRTGYLLKFSKKGYIFKTYEGELNMGGMNSATNTVLNNLWDFSVLSSNQEIIDSLNEYEGRVIKIDYKEKIRNMPWQGDTKYFAQKVKLVR